MNDEREQLQDLENHRHEDEFSPDFEDEELSSEPFVETNDGDVDRIVQDTAKKLGINLDLSPTDKLLILLDDSISLKERLERTGERRSTILRRTERCECGHTKFWHMSDGKCMCDIHRQGGVTLDISFTCPCVEYLPQADRRSK